MQNRHFGELTRFFSKIYEQIHIIKKEINEEVTSSNNTHKIKKISVCDKTNRIFVEFSVSGVARSLPFKVLAKELFIDNKTLKCFDQLSVRLITILAMKDYHGSSEPEAHIVEENFDEKAKTIFIIKFRDRLLEKNAEEILYDPEILNCLSVKDITNISFTAGYERSSS
jgi:hypothetical protein